MHEYLLLDVPMSRGQRRRLRRYLHAMAFVTTPTSLLKRLTGQEAFTDPLNFGGVAQTMPAGTTVGGYAVDIATRTVVVAPATTTLTLTVPLHAGNFLNIASTGGLAITPPAATGTFNIYTFLVTATISGGSFTIDAKAGNAADIFAGIAWQNLPGTGVTQTGTAANTNLITLNGTTTGGKIGDWICMVDVALHTWNLEIFGQYSGTFATPFSNH